MWPKVFAQFVELLPHITRLIPMADRFFQSRTASEKANEAALSALVHDVRADLGQVASAHDALYRQLQAQSAQLADVAADAHGTRLVIESYVDRVTALEQKATALAVWVKSIVALLLLVLAGIVTLLVKLR